MHPSTAALLMAFTAQLLHVSVGSTWLASVPIVDGNCVYENKKIPVEQSIFLEEPCERLTCSPGNATHGYVDGSGCGKARAVGASCKLTRHKGKYPECCPTVVCGTSTAPKARRHG
ncbi:U-scoloptoxin(16)-Er12a-like [Amblyomma americanum]